MSLYASSHTYTYRLRIRTGRPANPLTGTVLQNTVPASYRPRMDIIAISYIVIAYKGVISRAGAHHAIPCHAMRRGWQILRAGNTAHKFAPRFMSAHDTYFYCYSVN